MTPTALAEAINMASVVLAVTLAVLTGAPGWVAYGLVAFGLAGFIALRSGGDRA